MLGAGVAHLVVEVWTATHATVARIGNQLPPLDGELSLLHNGVQRIALSSRLQTAHVGGYGPMVAVKVQIDGGDIAGMVDVEHLAPVVGGDAEARHVAVSRSIDGSAHTVVSPNAEVDTTVEMVGAYLGKGAGRRRVQMKGIVELRWLQRLGRSRHVAEDHDKKEESAYGRHEHVCFSFMC